MTGFRFGPFDFDKRLLRRDGQPVKLTDRQASVLTLLLERRPQLVTHHELLAVAFGPRSIRNSLDQVVHQLRVALSDEQHVYIQTHKGRGFVFGANVLVKDLPGREALSDYQVGLQRWNDREPDALQQAMDCFDRAVHRSPQFGAAHAARADCYAILGSYGWSTASHAANKAKAAAHNALAFEGDLAQPHATLGFVGSLFEHDWSEAERHFSESLRRAPEYGTAHHWLALQLAALNETAKACEHIELARKHDPLSRIIDAHAVAILYWGGQLDAADEACRDAIAFNDRFWYVHHLQANVREAQGRFQEALAKQKQAVECFGRPSTMLGAALARAYALTGATSDARRELEPLRATAQRGAGAFHLATAFAALGEKDDAFDLLSLAIDHHDVWVSFLAVDPRVDTLRDDTRFTRLLSRLRVSRAH